ncbi:MAG: methyltransferase domain-containing protein [Firmicutes bacterium]|nr:methyltransferase domain-containing protein [Bacillota bacterium]
MVKKALLFARELVAAAVEKGATVVDATCGNGHDTVFLAELVGAAGRVYAFDIQEKAIAATKERLGQHGLLDRVTLLHASHDDRAKWPPAPVSAVMFNLGYLPGGDHSLVTTAKSSVAALQIATDRLKPGGIITLVVYTGHPGGREEYSEVRRFLTGLPQAEYTVLEYRLINQVNNPPLLLAVQRLYAGRP